ncbi:tyrosine-type recombinase/integrase [Dyadobacter frigoris]|uniref:tyrosine-type recombinase/integrase n=1 Tax=Dyadobacter frigoris TaxID=2576211 RepID=UPI002554D329|nr:tyrosine-type recombinase/integrase [Dyadobacter frigoris]
MNRYYSSFEELTEAASNYLRNIGRGKQTISIYLWIWNRIKVYMDCKDLRHLSSQTVAAYLSEAYGDKTISDLTRHQKHCYRCALCLAQFAETGKMIEVINRRPAAVLDGEVGELIRQYIEYKKSVRICEKTTKSYFWYLYCFQQYLHRSGITSIKVLSPITIVNYVTTLLPDAAGAKHLALSIIRNFLSYLFGLGKTARDLSFVIPRDNYKKQAKLPSVYTRAEITTILDSIDRSTLMGKRDYALVLLAVRLGLRASDISGLEFSHLLWSQNIISFRQRKTREVLRLPLPADVGEALIDYIRYSRPSSKEPFVFLEKLFPHPPIDAKRVSKIATQAILQSGIKVGERKHGSHALRHTMASMLLESQVSIPVISSILGHASIQTSMCYLRIDIQTLRQCALEVPSLPEEFYTQNKGAFYE